MILESRMTPEQLTEAKRLFSVPEQFYDAVEPMVREVEWQIILAMGERDVPDAELREICVKNRLSEDAYDLIRECYHRNIIDQVRGAETLTWHISDFYCRYPIYAQYEYYDFGRFPREVIDAMYEWEMEEIFRRRGHLILQKMKEDDSAFVVNQTYLTLPESYEYMEKYADHIYLHACNCKSMKYFHGRPINTCMTFYTGPNGEIDRGYGEKLTLEQAKAKIKEFNSKGLMQNGEDYAICNCDGLCCMPQQSGVRLGTRGFYPKSNYLIDWHEDECISCGRCTKICNFGAFYKKEDGKVTYDPDKCWGCTICSENCPKKAIHLIPKE